MKIKTKENKGITLMALVITIVIMIILVSVATYTGIDTYNHSKTIKFITQMQLLQGKVDENDNNDSLGVTIEDTLPNYTQIVAVINSAKTKGEILNTNEITNFKYFSTENLRKQLDVEDIEDEILINFETREVVSLKGLKYEGEVYYTQYLLPGGQKIIQNTATNSTLSFTLDTYINGLNASVNIKDIKRTIDGSEKDITNGIVKYKLLLDDNAVYNNYEAYNNAQGVWENVSNNNVNLIKSGRYVFTLEDLIKTTPAVREVTIKLANAPKLTNGIGIKAKYDAENNALETSTVVEEKWYNYSGNLSEWAYAAEDENNPNYYIWIPRFAYKTEDSVTTIKFLKGNSNIPTDNSAINIEPNSWIIPTQFIKNGQPLRGIWLKIDLLDGTKYNYIGNVIENDIIETLSSSLETDIIQII